MTAPAENAETGAGGAPVRPANKRGVARLAAVQALYQMDIAGGSVGEVVEEFERFRLCQEIDGAALREADLEWFEAILAGVVENQRAIDRLIDATLKAGWPLRRIDLTLRAILRAGAFELMRRPEVKARFVISEYVDVAKAFFHEDEPRIVNGVLDGIARQVRPGEVGERPREEPPQGA